MTEMKCKLTNLNGSVCGKDIDYNKDTKKATNPDGSPHIHERKPFPKTWSKKGFKPDLQYDAVLKEVALIRDDVESLKEAVRALVAEVSFKKADGSKLD